MDIINNKREQKTHDKKQYSKGKKAPAEVGEKTVDFFKAGDDKTPERKHVGNKRTSKKFVPKKDESEKVVKKG